jgi:4-diphosphocytidyl-2-methyl-D-erithritol synthase
MMKNALVILAGGKGKRFGHKIPKQFLKIGNTNFLNYFISNLELSNFDVINISIDKKYQKTYFNYKIISEKIKITYSKPGLTRQVSSFNALKKFKKI